MTMTPLAILLLYIGFRIKQFTCDFLLQTGWMALNKGKSGYEGYKALLSHCLVHGAGTVFVVTIFAPTLWWLGLVDLAVHAAIDRFKGVLTRKKGWNPDNIQFWWAFGLDQEAHNLTHLAYLLIIVAYRGIILT